MEFSEFSGMRNHLYLNKEKKKEERKTREKMYKRIKPEGIYDRGRSSGFEQTPACPTISSDTIQ